MKHWLPCCLVLTGLLACNPAKTDPETIVPASTVTPVPESATPDGVQVTFQEHTGLLSNPERGHYRAPQLIRRFPVSLSSG